MIALSNISFSYQDGREVFENLNLRVERNDRIAIVGPNGSGKTTLFHLIMGFQRPETGKIEILGKERKNEKDFDEVRARIGFLFQNPEHQLFCPTVAEDIAFGPLNLGKTRKETEDVVDKTAALLGLECFLDRVSYRLSWGEKRIVALATVVAMNPEMLLLDEPTEGLDGLAEARVVSFLKNWKGVLIIASHDKGLLKSLSVDKYTILNGKIK